MFSASDVWTQVLKLKLDLIKNHLPRLDLSAAFEPIDVHARGQARSIEPDAVPARGHHPIHQHRHFTAQEIINRQLGRADF